MQTSGASRRENAKSRLMIRVRHTLSRRRPPPGRRIAPPDDRLQRAIQYSETSMMEPESCGVLDTPLEPVVGLAEGETRWRSMTIFVRSAATSQSILSLRVWNLRGTCHRARIRATRWRAMTVWLFEIQI